MKVLALLVGQFWGWLVAGYLVGSIPFGVLIAGPRVLTEGSKSYGTSNVLRLFGAKKAALTLLCDLSKAAVMAKLVLIQMNGSQELAILVGYAAILGHSYPVWFGFRGGKGVAALLGLGLVLDHQVILAALAVFLIVLGFSRYISLSSMIAAVSFVLFMYLKGDASVATQLVVLFIALHVIVAHRGNISRLLNGTEDMFLVKKLQVPEGVELGCFTIHATSDNLEDVKRLAARKYGFVRHLPAWLVYVLLPLTPVLIAGHSDVIVASDGSKIILVFIVVPMTPKQMKLFAWWAVRRIVLAARIGEKMGAKQLGLGAFTAIVGDHGLQVAKAANIAVTTGNSATAVLAVEGALCAALKMGNEPEQCTAAVPGATGQTGGGIARLLAGRVKHILLVGRDVNDPRLARLQRELASAPFGVTSSIVTLEQALSSAQIIIVATSATEPILVDPELLLPGAVVCDVARPRAVAEEVHRQRDDVLVIDGGLGKVPGNPNLGFEFGLGRGNAFGCMIETMLLVIMGIDHDFSIGEELEWEQLLLMSKMQSLGFELGPLRYDDAVLTDEEINQRRSAANQRKEAR